MEVIGQSDNRTIEQSNNRTIGRSNNRTIGRSQRWPIDAARHCCTHDLQHSPRLKISDFQGPCVPRSPELVVCSICGWHVMCLLSRAMDHLELLARTNRFAREIVQFTKPMFRAMDTADIAKQLRRAGTGVAFNYRAAGRARSHAEFTARIGVVLEEADESKGWLELIGECELAGGQRLQALTVEAEELVAIFAKSWETTSDNTRPGGRRTRRHCP